MNTPGAASLRIAARQIILVKHARPILDAEARARDWRLSKKGEDEAVRLGAALRDFAPCRLVTSPEPKAVQTSAIVAAALGIVADTVEDLREIDRPVLPIMSHGEHERYNRRLFEDFDRRVLGSESAQEAQVRFARALLKEVSETGVENLVAVTHGTVIALFVCDYNREIDSFGLWRRLDCCSFVVLGIPAMEVLHIGDGADPRRPGHAGLRETSRNG